MRRSLDSRCVLTAVCCVVLAACGPSDGEAYRSLDAAIPEAQRYGGTAVIGAGADVADINPLTSTTTNAQYLQLFALFTPLLRYDEHFEPQPYGATSWELNRDTTELIFHLRDDPFWHDGVRTTAHDWKFTCELARDPATGYTNLSAWTYYAEAEVVDSLTLRVRLQPHAEFLDPWTHLSPVPRHLLEGTPPERLRAHPFSTGRPLGNGPFQFVSRVPGQSWTLEANPDFPHALGGQPYLDRVVYRVIPEHTTRLTELLTGRIDFSFAVDPEQAARIRASGTARIAEYPARGHLHIAWNHRRWPFGDARVRRALTLAIDRQRILDGIRHGYGQVAQSTVAPVYWQHDPTAGAEIGYDPQRAAALLAEAGFRSRNREGVLQDEQGRPFSFTLLAMPDGAMWRDVAEVVQSDLRRVGIDVRLQMLEFNALVARLNNPGNRDFDAVLMNFVTAFRLDDSELFACGSRSRPYAWSGYCHPETDRLLDTLPRIADREAARPLWQAYQRRLAEDQPYTFLLHSRALQGVSKRLRDVEPDARGPWVGMARWWIAPADR